MYGIFPRDINNDASTVVGGISPWNTRGLPTSNTGTGGTGVSRGPLDPWTARMQYLKDTGRGGGGVGGMVFGSPGKPKGVDPVQTQSEKQIAEYRSIYGALADRLAEYGNQERQNISQASSRAATFLGDMDPMAGYRPTFQSLQSPQAAMVSYLNAIGANPSQVQAQQSLSDQLMAAQTGNQSQFASAVDDSQRNYRLAQLAEVYANQAKAESLLGSVMGSQNTAINLAGLDKEAEINKMLLEYQMQIAIEAMRNRGL